MSRFSNIMKGTRAIRRVTCPIVNVAAKPADGAAEVPSQFECGVRVLSVAEQESVYEMALARTKRLGGEENESSNIYNLSLQIYTIATAYVDPDSDPGAAKLYFGDTIQEAAENILKSELLSRDSLAYLAEQQELWQDECNPQKAPGQSEMLKCIEEGAKDASFFLYLRPGARLTLMHTLANMVLSSRTDKSPDTSGSGESTKSVPNKAPKNSKGRVSKSLHS